MKNSTQKEINNWLQQWGQFNPPEYYTHYRYKDYLFVFGDCSGIVVYPDGKRLLYSPLHEDDQRWWVNSEWKDKSIGWLSNDIACYKVALEYIEEYGTIQYCKDTNVPCGWKLPWLNE